MHKKKIRNLLIPVFLSGMVLGSVGGITAEEIPADTETVLGSNGVGCCFFAKSHIHIRKLCDSCVCFSVLQLYL